MKMRKILNGVLACTMALSMVSVASAHDMGISNAFEADDIVYLEVLPLYEEEEIGYTSEETGSLIDDGVSNRSTGLPFSMQAINVSTVLTTRFSSGKNFSGGVFDYNEGLKISGTVNHTYGSSYNVKVGACNYNTSTGAYVSTCDIRFNSGVAQTATIPKYWYGTLFLHNSITYYGHITNPHSVGTVSGTLNFAKVTV